MRIEIVDSPQALCRLCLVQMIAGDVILPDVELRLTAGALRQMLTSTRIFTGYLP